MQVAPHAQGVAARLAGHPHVAPLDGAQGPALLCNRKDDQKNRIPGPVLPRMPGLFNGDRPAVHRGQKRLAQQGRIDPADVDDRDRQTLTAQVFRVKEPRRPLAQGRQSFRIRIGKDQSRPLCIGDHAQTLPLADPQARPEFVGNSHHHAVEGRGDMEHGRLFPEAPVELLGLDILLDGHFPLLPQEIDVGIGPLQQRSGQLDLGRRLSDVEVEFGRGQIKERLALVYPGRGAHMHLFDPGGKGRIEFGEFRRPEDGRQQLVAAPGQEEEQGQERQQGEADDAVPVPVHFPALPVPEQQFLLNGQPDEAEQFDCAQNNAQHLDEEVVHHQGDAGKNHQAIEPDAQGIENHETPDTGPDLFRRRIAEAEDQFAQPPPGQRHGPGLQVLDACEVGEQVVAVPAHEGADVDRQGHDPGGGGEKKGGVAQDARRQDGPGQGAEHGQRAFRSHAGGDDMQPLPSGGEFPAFAGIGVEKRPEHQKGDADDRHVQAVVFAAVGMAEFVAALGHKDGGSVVDERIPAEKLQGGADEGVPLPQHEEEREQGRDPQEAAEARAEQRPHQPQGVAEKGIRPQDGDAEEEVVGHQKPAH